MHTIVPNKNYFKPIILKFKTFVNNILVSYTIAVVRSYIIFVCMRAGKYLSLPGEKFFTFGIAERISQNT